MIYIAGPVTGYEDDNRPAFEEARERIIAAGAPRYETFEELVEGYWEPTERDNISLPHDVVPLNASWTEAMRQCIRELTRADTLVYLPGSQDSRGARLEMKVARELGIPVYGLEQYLRHLKHRCV